jgi:hypothetical protein
MIQEGTKKVSEIGQDLEVEAVLSVPAVKLEGRKSEDRAESACGSHGGPNDPHGCAASAVGASAQP